MFDSLHSFLNQVLFGADSDLAWAAVRSLSAICSLIAAHAVRDSPDRFLAWTALFLGAWLGLKVADDLAHAGTGPKLTTYFIAANLAWCTILIGLARTANRERAWLKGQL